MCSCVSTMDHTYHCTTPSALINAWLRPDSYFLSPLLCASSQISYECFQKNWEASVASGKPDIKRVLLKTWGKVSD